jgi:hypothetical protein
MQGRIIHMGEKIVQTAGREAHAAEMVFPIGAPNDAFAQYGGLK